MTSVKIFDANRALVRHTLKRYFRHRVRTTLHSDEDVEQIGDIALWRACETFDPSRGVRFTTYAVNVIRNEIGKALSVDNAAKRGRGVSHVSLTPELAERVACRVHDDRPGMVDAVDFVMRHTNPHYRPAIQAHLDGESWSRIAVQFGYKNRATAKACITQAIRRTVRKLRTHVHLNEENRTDA